MTKRNEQTGKKVGSASSKLLRGGLLDDLRYDVKLIASHCVLILKNIDEIEAQVESVAASALTQSPDKPKRRK